MLIWFTWINWRWTLKFDLVILQKQQLFHFKNKVNYKIKITVSKDTNDVSIIPLNTGTPSESILYEYNAYVNIALSGHNADSNITLSRHNADSNNTLLGIMQMLISSCLGVMPIVISHCLL